MAIGGFCMAIGGCPMRKPNNSNRLQKRFCTYTFSTPYGVEGRAAALALRGPLRSQKSPLTPSTWRPYP